MPPPPQCHNILLHALQAPGFTIIANIFFTNVKFTITSRGKDFEHNGQAVHGEADRGGELEALASSWGLPVEPVGWRVSFSSDPFSTIALDTGEPSPGL